ncbi:hypothetical protein K3495_g1695 [Podosphaera aphanis]|nr:hypothetical protein K3495_g1695 [Podosphaera aphanis]
MSPRKPVSATANRIYKSSTPKIQSKLTTPRTTIKKHLTYGKKSSVKNKTLTQMWEWGKFKDGWSDNKYIVQSQDEDELPGMEKANDASSFHPAFSSEGIVQERENTSDIDLSFSDVESLTSPGLKSKERMGHKNLVGFEPSTRTLTQTSGSSTSGNELGQTAENENDPEDHILIHDEPHPLASSYRSSNAGKPREVSPCPRKDSLTPRKGSLGRIQTPQTPFRNPSLEVPSSQSPATPMSLPIRRSGKSRMNSPGMFPNSPHSVSFKRKLRFSPRKSLSPVVRDTFEASSLSPDVQKLPRLKKMDTTARSMNYNRLDGIPWTSSRQSGNLVESMPASLQQDIRVIHSPLLTEGSPSCLSSQKSVTKSKVEILDSEAETDEEYQIAEVEELREEKTPHENISPNTFEMENSFACRHENYSIPSDYEQIGSAKEQPSVVAHETIDNFNETLGLQTLIELDKLMASDRSLRAVNKGKQKLKWEVPRAASDFKPSLKPSEQRIFPSEETQNYTTQRLSTQYLGQMAPRTGESDIFMSIDPQRLAEILNRSRNHETRRYKLPPPVCRAWLYERSPISAIKYMAEISSARRPGQIIDETGIGNKAFNLKQSTSSWTAYEILQLYELANPLTLKELKEKEWLKSAPKPLKWTKVPPAVADELIANIKSPLFNSDLDTNSAMNPLSPPSDIQEANFPEPDLISQLTTSTFSAQNSLAPWRNSDTMDPQQMLSNESTPRRKVRASSQATTVDLSQEETPRNQHIADTAWETPVHIDLPPHRSSSTVSTPFSMASSMVLTRSQLLPESLLNGFTSIPPSLLPSSEHDLDI